MKSFLECWVEAASALLPQALAGAPELVECAARPLADGAFGLAAAMGGAGRFSILLESSVLETSLLGGGVEQRTAWMDLLRETLEAAACEFGAETERRFAVGGLEEISGDAPPTRAFQIRSGERNWMLLVRDEVAGPIAGDEPEAIAEAGGGTPAQPGLELLLDVELEASLRFGSREMLLGEILDLGPGDVVQLDRQVADPVDLIVADKIVARGDVVLVNGNFGLKVTEVASPRKRLESIRCLF